MRAPILKLCGFTIAAQAAAAARLGATHVGIVLWPRSKRAATADQARAIVAATRTLRPETVGVVVDERGADLLALVESIGLDRLQLHGDHTLDDAALLTRAGVPFWRALRVGADGVDLALARRWRAAGADAVLLDAYVPGLPGGTGAHVATDRAREFADAGPTVLAGGLTPANVAERIRAVRPRGVDVASGIERAPGDKDEAALARFVDEARAAFEEIG